MSCERCGSFAINHAAHGRDGSEPSLCDVCYWRQRTEQCTASNATKDAEIARLTGCLERANAQAEHFEREWYLRGEVLDTAEYWLGSLLAVIHRDGGHYEAEHGTARAADDAIAAVHVLRGSLEGYIEANRYMKGELDDAMEDARKYAEAKGEIARLRHEVATLCGYDSADEMDAATGRRK